MKKSIAEIVLILFSVFLLVTFISCNQEARKPGLMESVVFDTTEIDSWNGSQWIGFTWDSRDSAYAMRSSQRFDEPEPILRRVFSSSLLRNEFEAKKAIRSAHAYVCALGLYELYINGDKVGDHVLNPAPTTYNKLAFYVSYNVADLLKKGNNAVGLMLGSGFYGQNFAFKAKLFYGSPRVRMILKVTYEDGSEEDFCTTEHWKVTQSPIVFDNIYAGETYDARLELPGWSEPGFNDGDWHAAEVQDAEVQKIDKQKVEPIRKIRPIKPIAIFPATNSGWILDMGENMTSWLHIAVNEPSGTVLKMQFTEHLMPSGMEVDPASTGVYVTSAPQTDIYICKGDGPEEWEPRFTYHGFRYVRIDGLSKRPDLSNFTGWLIRTDVDRIGHFECSDSLVNKFYEVSIRTLEDNIQGTLTDCPHRERCAWLGDILVGAEMASYNFNMQQFWRKTVADFETVLGANLPNPISKLPFDNRAPANIASGHRLCYQAHPDWGAATVLVPWYNYLYYGDLESVKKHWPMMQGWIDFLSEFAVNENIIEEGFGDWCPPGSNSKIDTPVALTSTALFYQNLCAMKTLAVVLEDQRSAEKYDSLGTGVKEAFNSRFFMKSENHYGSQTGTVVAIHAGLVPVGEEQAVADALAKQIMDESNGRYTTGIFEHRPLYTVLNDFGYGDVTSHLWSLTDWPSLGFMTEEHDLTTWPEVALNWDKSKPYPRSSFNHPMHGGFAATFHESLGGIRPDPKQPGFKNIILKPCFLNGVKWVKVEHRSSYGMIRSEWEQKRGDINWQINVPDNCTATVQLPAYKKSNIKKNGEKVSATDFHISAGKWLIEISNYN